MHAAQTRRQGVSARLPMNCSDQLAPVRLRAVLDQIDALPGAERERAAAHRDVQRNAGQHGLDMRRHVVGAFDGVHPGAVVGREPAQRRDRSACTSGSAFSWMVSEAEVWRR